MITLTPETRRAIVEAAKAANGEQVCSGTVFAAMKTFANAKFTGLATPQTILAYEEALTKLEESIVGEELEWQAKRIKELEAALRPFAEQAQIIDAQRQDGEKWTDDAWFRFGASVTAITLGDCRAALKALERKS
jgi:hypothetical protein